VERVGLRAQTAGSGAVAVEVAAKGGSHEGAEDDIGTPENRQREPQEEDKLEGVVEGEPVDHANKTLNNGEKGEDNPVCQPLCVVGLARREKRIQRVVSRDHKTSEIGQELAAEVEDNQEEVQRNQADDSVGLGHRRALLEVVQSGVFGQLLVELSNVVLNAVLGRRHYVC
jgi:hypothetical protein